MDSVLRCQLSGRPTEYTNHNIINSSWYNNLLFFCASMAVPKGRGDLGGGGRCHIIFIYHSPLDGSNNMRKSSLNLDRLSCVHQCTVFLQRNNIWITRQKSSRTLCDPWLYPCILYDTIQCKR